MTGTCTNGVGLPLPTLEGLLHAVDELEGDRRRMRTDELLDQMREKGFDPDRDYCFIPAQYQRAFKNHFCFRFHPLLQSACFIRHDLFDLVYNPEKVLRQRVIY